MEPQEYIQFFASLITYIMLPGQDEWKCSREFLGEEDFWLDTWGPKPPIHDDNAEGDFDGNP
jgi:hypothetical protein